MCPGRSLAIPVLQVFLVLAMLLPLRAGEVRHYSVERAGQQFGEIVIERDSDPVSLRIRNDQQIRFRLLGITQEMQERVDFHLDRIRGDRRVLLVSRSPLREATVELQLSGRRAMIRELPQGRSRAWTAESELYLEMDYILAHGVEDFAPGELREFLAVDPENFRLETVSVRLLAAEPARPPRGCWTFEIRRSVLVSEETYDRDMNLLQGKIPALGLEIRPRRNTDRMELFELAGQDLLEFPWPIEDWETVEACRCRIAFRGIDPEELELEGPGQTLRAMMRQGDSLEARLELRSKDLSEAFTATVADAVRATDSVHLRDSAQIRVDGPAIRGLLAKIFPGRDSPAVIIRNWRLDRVVEAVIDGLQARIVQEAVADRMNSEEVLAAGRGMCMHYATVFAAAMRSLGIPTRCVMGQIYVGDRFLPHMYNEVWNGQDWLPVDSVQRPFCRRSNPLLIRLGSGRDLGDLAALKARLIRHMELLSLDVTARTPGTR